MGITTSRRRTRGEALTRDLVDVCMSFEPGLTQVLDGGGGTIWIRGREIAPDFQYSHLLVGSRLLDAVPRPRTRRFVRAYLRGVECYINEEKSPRLVEILAPAARASILTCCGAPAGRRPVETVASTARASIATRPGRFRGGPDRHSRSTPPGWSTMVSSRRAWGRPGRVGLWPRGLSLPPRLSASVAHPGARPPSNQRRGCSSCFWSALLRVFCCVALAPTFTVALPARVWLRARERTPRRRR